MEKPANSVVNSLRLGEGLVATLVCCQESIRDVRVNVRSGKFHIPMTQSPVATNPAEKA